MTQCRALDIHIKMASSGSTTRSFVVSFLDKEVFLPEDKLNFYYRESLDNEGLEKEGRELFSTLFNGQITELLKETEKTGDMLALRFWLDTENPFKFPAVEFLHDGTTFLTAPNPDTIPYHATILRCYPSSLPSEKEEISVIEYPLGILLVGPIREKDLKLGNQILSFCNEHCLKPLIAKGYVILDRLTGSELNLENIKKAIKTGRYKVLHISCHGDIDKETGIPYLKLGKILLDVREFGKFLSELPQSGLVKVLYLDACKSGVINPCSLIRLMEHLVDSGIKYLIVMQAQMFGDSSITFSSAFYSRFAYGSPIESAIHYARMCTRSKYSSVPDWGMPLLYQLGKGTLKVGG